MRTIGLVLAAVAALALGGGARAAVVEATPTSLQVKQSAEIAAPAAKVWAALGHVGSWWNSEHSWSGDAKNLTLELKAGGCLCEANLPGGGAAHHMTVLMAMPGKTAVLDGTIGPLMFGGAAATWSGRWPKRTARRRSPRPTSSAATTPAASTSWPARSTA